MNELTKEIREGVPRELMFTDDLALTEESRAGKDTSVCRMESCNGIKRIESQYRENKVNGN